MGRAKAAAEIEAKRIAGEVPEKLQALLDRANAAFPDPTGKSDLTPEQAAALHRWGASALNTQFGSCVFACKPGDGSAREQAASCQKVLGGFANICYQFATKRYRSNCINWGILPFTLDEGTDFPYEAGDCIYIPEIRDAIRLTRKDIHAKMLKQDGGAADITLHVTGLTAEEREIILDGCLMY